MLRTFIYVPTYRSRYVHGIENLALYGTLSAYNKHALGITVTLCLQVGMYLSAWSIGVIMQVYLVDVSMYSGY